MVAAPEYSLEKQAKLVNAICALHNFIRAYDPDDGDDINPTEVERASPQHLREDFAVDVTATEREEASEKRDQIAKAMWEQYVAYNEGL
jgi:fumarylacetoacetate (FAA) hydrolase family protein